MGRLPDRIVQMGVRFYEVLDKILLKGIICRKLLTENIKPCNYALRFLFHDIRNFCQAVIFIMLLTILKVPFLSLFSSVPVITTIPLS